LTSEDRIHLVLLLALGATNLAILGRGPSASPPDATPGAALAAAHTEPTEVTSVELESAIQRLETWLASSRTRVAPGGPAAAALQGLGPSGEDRAHPERWLARLIGSENTHRWLLPAVGGAGPGVEHAAALAVLLEAGVPLTRGLSSAAAEKAPGVTLSDLVQRSLGSPEDPPEPHAADDPAQLDLLSLAVLGGLSQYRARLSSVTLRGLQRLEHAQRTQNAAPGAGALTAPQLEQLATAWRAEPGASSAELHWSSAVFRGTAVLGEADLDEQARRHLNSLLARYPSDRALYLYLEARAPGERERRQLQLWAIENLGRFEEALYNAHLTLRSDSRGGPTGSTAQVMRFAARDLIERLEQLDASDFELERPGSEPGALLRAAVQALRGLRTARIAG
jgi:hypothetical protein